MYTKSGSYIKISFFILNKLLLLTLGFNSLDLNSNISLIFLTIILPRHSLILVLILNDWVKFKIILQPFILPIIFSKPASNA